MKKGTRLGAFFDLQCFNLPLVVTVRNFLNCLEEDKADVTFSFPPDMYS